MNPLVSVIVPVYNAAPFVEQTLHSITESHYSPLEVIAVDDGSTDESLAILQRCAAADPRIHVFTQANAGVSAARNHAIREAKGKYILPVDADDLISPEYIAKAVEVLEAQSADDNDNVNENFVRVVGCRARMFGAVEKEWKLPRFSHALLARKNMIPVSSMFRREDWERVGGFCEEDIYREDWDFWISLFELGGTYHLLDHVGLFYRVLPHSRRAGAKAKKHAIVDAINRRHPDYLRRYLGGPLHYHRSWSRLINMLRTEKTVGQFEHWNEGEIIYAKRNTIRLYADCVTKSFAVPPLWRGIIYGLFAKSKARRSYEYAQRLSELTPAPIAYREVRILGILRESDYVCRLSECTHTFNELIGHPEFANRQQILQSIGRFTAELHRRGVWHQDYSGGNILFNDDGSRIEIVDLNRIRFSIPSQPLLAFERLNIDREALRAMTEAYAEVMGCDKEQAVAYVISHRWHKHIKKGITNL